ncbi:hypothetical protein ACFL2Q_15750 [Thermodesulfobacteriota bacterium]
MKKTRLLEFTDATEITVSERFSSLFPINPDTLAAIEKHMASNGFLSSHPLELAVWPEQEEPVLVDGHTRRTAAMNVGIESVPTVTIEFDSEDEALGYAVHSQADRRNLTNAELFTCAIQVDEIKPRGSKKKGTRVPNSGERNMGTGGRSADQTAALLNTNRKKIKQIRAIHRHGGDEIISAVTSGAMSINQAYKSTQRRRQDRREAPAGIPSVVESDTVDWIATLLDLGRDNDWALQFISRHPDPVNYVILG